MPRRKDPGWVSAETNFGTVWRHDSGLRVGQWSDEGTYAWHWVEAGQTRALTLRNRSLPGALKAAKRAGLAHLERLRLQLERPEPEIPQGEDR